MKKHSRQEVFLKLAQADALAQAGSSQVQICRSLGVSVMTLHRWRKLPRRQGEFPGEGPAQTAAFGSEGPPTVEQMHRLVEELTTENRRLRKIVTDLMLEKVQIGETHPAAVVHQEGREH